MPPAVRTLNSIGKAAFIAAATVIALYTLYTVRHALFTLYVACVLAVLFDPLVRLIRRARIRHYRPSRGMATAVTVLLTAALLVLIGFVIVPPVMTDAAQLQRQWPETSAQLFDSIHRTLPFSRSLTADSVAAWLHRVAGKTPVLTVGATMMDVLVTLLLAIYMLADGPTAFEWMVSFAPDPWQRRTADAFRSAARRMQGWVGGQGVLMLTHGGSAFITFWLLGLPYVFALAVFAAAINVIPVLGPILTLVVASLVALTSSPEKLLGVAIFYLAYHNAEGLYLQPRIMSSAVGIPGVAIVVALVIGDEIAGFIGMALAVPTAVLVAELKRFAVGRAREPAR